MTSYPFWIEHTESGALSKYLWVKVDSIPANGNKLIYIRKYGTTSPSAQGTFEYFDSFDSNTSSNYSIYQSGSGDSYTYDPSGKTMHFTCHGRDGTIQYMARSINLSNFAVKAKIKYINNPSDEYSNQFGVFMVKELSADPQGITVYLNDDYDPSYTSERVYCKYLSNDGSGKHTEALTQDYGTNISQHEFVIEIKKGGNTYIVDLYIDGATTPTVTKTYTFTTDSINYYGFGDIYPLPNYNYHKSSTSGYFDDVIVRNYASNEPSVNVVDYGAYYEVNIVNKESYTLSNYQVAIPLSELPAITSASQKLDVTNTLPAVDETIFPYWIEHSYDNNPGQKVWVKIDKIPANSTKIITAIKTSGHSPDGEQVFDFFDDFTTSNLDLSKWDVKTLGSNASISLSGSIAHFHRGTSDSNITIQSINKLTGYKIITYSYKIAYNYTYYDSIFYGESSQISSISYSLWSGYESALYTGNAHNAPRASSSGSTDGDEISDPPINTWFIDKFTIPNGHLSRTLSGTTETSSRYSGVSSGYVGLHQGYTSSKGMDSYIDYITVRQWVSSEPTVIVTKTGSNKYEITIINNSSSDLVGYQIPVSANKLEISSTTESIKFTDQYQHNFAIAFSHNC